MIVSLPWRIIRTISTRHKLPVELDKNILEAVEQNNLKPKRHPGIFKNSTINLPKEITKAIHVILKDDPWTAFHKESMSFARYLSSRHLPPEKAEIEQKTKEARAFVDRKYRVNYSEFSSEEMQSEEMKRKMQKYERKIEDNLRQRLYSWKPIEYSEHKAKLYLIGRAAAEYAVIYKLFSDIKQKQLGFEPKTIFDFGSGVGTVTWAAKSVWQDSFKEYFCVDTSSVMNDLAALILKGGRERDDVTLKGVFYRQFLPMTHILTYDIVISAYTLFEMPNLQSRLETVLSLWKKTQNFLIIIERGTNAGFQVINEARDFILEYSNNTDNSLSDQAQAHVFAPCPHDKLCPRFTDDRTPCNFIVPYNTFQRKQEIREEERFSYVILKKGPRNPDDPQWPRIVRPTLLRSRHVVCRMCTSKGKLKEVVFTPSKHGKIPYRCAKYSKWGDLLPVHLEEEDDADTEIDPSNSNC